MKSIARLFCLVWMVMLLQACSDDTVSAEDEIRRLIDTGVTAAENRDLDSLGELMHDDYRDHKGYGKKQLSRLLRGYFFQHKNIHLFTRIDEIELLDETRATVRLHVAMAGSAISGIDALSALRARVYRFELELIRQDDWLLRHALWKPANIVDLE